MIIKSFLFSTVKGEAKVLIKRFFSKVQRCESEADWEHLKALPSCKTMPSKEWINPLSAFILLFISAYKLLADFKLGDRLLLSAFTLKAMIWFPADICAKTMKRKKFSAQRRCKICLHIIAVNVLNVCAILLCKVYFCTCGKPCVKFLQDVFCFSLFHCRSFLL